ncbi:hypothetical protein [Virgibacillus sp. Bac330]|nr:hypothetical protein [Virgibacillus sp. Bac330]
MKKFVVSFIFAALLIGGFLFTNGAQNEDKLTMNANIPKPTTTYETS